MSGSRNQISVPKASALERLQLIAESQFSRMSLNVGREAVEVVLEVGEQLLLAPRDSRSRRVNFEVL